MWSIFFGIRSCEYLAFIGIIMTKCLRLINVRFSKNNVELKDRCNQIILFVDMVSIILQSQKNKKKMITEII